MRLAPRWMTKDDGLRAHPLRSGEGGRYETQSNERLGDSALIHTQTKCQVTRTAFVRTNPDCMRADVVAFGEDGVASFTDVGTQ